MSENRWKLWRMYAAGLPAMQFRNCRDAFYRTQIESPQNSDPDRFRIRFREPKDLMTDRPQELAGAGVRKYIFPEPFVFDRQGYPHWERSTLPDVNSVYLGGFEGEFISLRNPKASHKESGKLHGRRLQQFAGIDRGAVMFVHLGFAASPEGTPGLGKSFNGADFDDSVLALLDPEIVAHWKTLQDYPQVVATPTQVMVIDDGDALFDRHPKVEHYDDEFVIRMIVDARDGQMGIGCVVNAIVWFNLLWLNRESVLAQLRAMEPSTKVLDAIRWMVHELPRSQMPMIASRLEEIIDSIKMNGKSVEWANGVITEFRNTCPVAPKFWWQGGFQGQGRIPLRRLGNGNEPIAVTTAMDVAGRNGSSSSKRHASSPTRRVGNAAGECLWRSGHSPLALRQRLPPGTSGCYITALGKPRRRSSSRLARTIAARRSRASRRPAWPLICSRRRMSTIASKPAACIWRFTRNWSS